MNIRYPTHVRYNFQFTFLICNWRNITFAWTTLMGLIFASSKILYFARTYFREWAVLQFFARIYFFANELFYNFSRGFTFANRLCWEFSWILIFTNQPYWDILGVLIFENRLFSVFRGYLFSRIGLPQT